MWPLKIMDDGILADLRALISERHPFSSPTNLRRAHDYLADQYERLGLEVSFHTFRAFGGSYKNVLGTLRPTSGASRSRKLPVIDAAHYDTVQGSPGADDNASGLAVMLEVARRLREASTRCEVRFIAMCLEEQNLLGSLAYAASLRDINEEIAGALVLECVGYTSDKNGSQTVPRGMPFAIPTVGDFLGVVGNTASAGLVKAFEQATNREVPELKTVSIVVPGEGEQLPDTRRSDHAAFWHFGYPAVMLTDTANFRNPHYHRPTDTLETLDLNFIHRVARGVSAAAMSL
jgi:Zn-dependent M28 family amino/carboxypeptidase